MRITTPIVGGIQKPKEMTGAAAFLFSADSAAVHGVTLLVDGGWLAW